MAHNNKKITKMRYTIDTNLKTITLENSISVTDFIEFISKNEEYKDYTLIVNHKVEYIPSYPIYPSNPIPYENPFPNNPTWVVGTDNTFQLNNDNTTITTKLND